MLLNAHSLHDVVKSHQTESSVVSNRSTKTIADKPMLNYILKGSRLEDSGGIFWTWRLIFSGEFFDTEGIWIPTRLLVIQLIQLVVTVVLSLIFLYITEYAADEAAAAQEGLPEDDDLPSWVKA
jgi:hypothetical protein